MPGVTEAKTILTPGQVVVTPDHGKNLVTCMMTLSALTPTNIPPLDKKYRRNEEFVSRQIADEFLLGPVSNQLSGDNWLFVLNEVGARIWELVDRGRSVQQIEELLLEEFDTSQEQLEKDLLRLLDQLQEIGAIEAVDG